MLMSKGCAELALPLRGFAPPSALTGELGLPSLTVACREADPAPHLSGEWGFPAEAWADQLGYHPGAPQHLPHL